VLQVVSCVRYLEEYLYKSRKTPYPILFGNKVIHIHDSDSNIVKENRTHLLTCALFDLLCTSLVVVVQQELVNLLQGATHNVMKQ